MILSQALNAAAQKSSGHPAIVDMGKAINYKDLRERVGRLSNFYQKENDYGARVALIAPNGVVFAQTLFALGNAGNPVFLVNPKDTDESIATDLRLLEIKKILASSDQLTRIATLFKDRGITDITVVEVDKKRAGEFDTTFQALPDRPLVDTDMLLILRQEDNGGERRYCTFSHRQIYTSCISVRKFYRMGPNDRFFTKMHWSHPFALTHSLLLPLFAGSTAVADPDAPSVEEFIEYVSTWRITRYVGPPNFFYQLLKYCASYKYKLPGVKSITIGMGTVPTAIRKTFGLLKIPVLECFGCPESVWSLAMLSLEKAQEGKDIRLEVAAGVKVAVLNGQGDEIGGEEKRQGRLSVTSGSMAAKYHQPVIPTTSNGTPPSKNFRGTWLVTDEIACLEGEGAELTVSVLGKVSNMICHEGNYFSAEKIDEPACRIPGVLEAAGFVYYNKEKKAHFACAVVLENRLLTERDILATLHEHLSPQLRPTKICVVDQLPRGLYDSIDRISLQRQFSTFNAQDAA